MDPKVLIESYVDDVVRRLPRRQRADVGAELRSLLGEELAARVAEGAPDEAMTLALLRGFGRPEDVAERYAEGGITIIKPSEATRFTWLALGGVALQWAVSLPAEMLGDRVRGGAPGSIGDAAYHVERWWLGPGLGALWWPGFLIVVVIIVAWMRRRWPESEAWAPPRVLDPDRVNRPLTAVGLAAWAAYILFLALAPGLTQRLPAPLAMAFAFDDGFLRSKAFWLFPVWLCDYAVHFAVFLQGRWKRSLRRASGAAGLAGCFVLGWFSAGPVFQAKAADDITRLILLLLAVLCGAVLALRLWRDFGGSRSLPYPASRPS
jgi:hypothetical protein